MQQQVLLNDEPRPNAADRISAELKSLHVELQRSVHELRMKSRGASAEARHLLEVLDREVKRFGGRVADAAADTRDDLMKVGEDLRVRLQKLANQVALPS